MTWIVEDAVLEIHEILEDERVLILASNQHCAQEWMRKQGLPPFGSQFTVSPGPRLLEGGRWPVIIVLECFEAHPQNAQIRTAIDRNVARVGRVKWISGACL